MKKLIYLVVASVLASASLFGARAQQPSTDLKIPISIYLPTEECNIPVAAQKMLTNKITLIATQNGMGASEEFAQFYATCVSTMLEKHVVGGAPAKYMQEVELTFHIVDAFAKKIFNSTSITVKGIGDSEQQAYINSFRKIPNNSPELKQFFTTTNQKIKSYYESQRETIIKMAQSLAKVYKYDEALFHLAIYPEACAGFDQVVDVATSIYQKYIDAQANRNLAKARSIWNAGLDANAAAEAAIYLAEILPEATCYKEALTLSEEIKQRVGDDIEYYRSLEARDNAQAHEVEMERIKAWKEVGLAFGNNQKENTYYDAWVLR